VWVGQNRTDEHFETYRYALDVDSTAQNDDAADYYLNECPLNEASHEGQRTAKIANFHGSDFGFAVGGRKKPKNMSSTSSTSRPLSSVESWTL